MFADFPRAFCPFPDLHSQEYTASVHHDIPESHFACCGIFWPWRPRWTAPAGGRAWSRSRPSSRASRWARRRWAAPSPPTGRSCGFCRWAGRPVSARTTAWSSSSECRGSGVIARMQSQRNVRYYSLQSTNTHRQRENLMVAWWTFPPLASRPWRWQRDQWWCWAVPWRPSSFLLCSFFSAPTGAIERQKTQHVNPRIRYDALVFSLRYIWHCE